jgi:thiamine pyrophosphate-dependent acetolactate synthase large subunit-like protein
MVEGDIKIPIFSEPPCFCPSFSEIKKAINLIGLAHRPLIIIGKGVAYARAEK